MAVRHLGGCSRSGPDLHLSAISERLRRSERRAQRRKAPPVAAHFPEDCLWPIMDDSDGTSMGTDRNQEVRTFRTTNGVQTSTTLAYAVPLPGLRSAWLVAQEAEMNDPIIIGESLRISSARILQANQWPPIFETIGDVMAAGAPMRTRPHFRTSATRRRNKLAMITACAASPSLRNSARPNEPSDRSVRRTVSGGLPHKLRRAPCPSFRLCSAFSSWRCSSAR